MKDIYTYILWLQVFANVISVVVTFLIGRIKITPAREWFTFCVSLSMALVYRIIKVLLTVPSFTFMQIHKAFFTLLGDVVLLPLIAFFIMVFTIQVYKTVNKRGQIWSQPF